MHEVPSESHFLLTSDSDMDAEEQLDSRPRLAAARSRGASSTRARTAQLFKEEVNLKFAYIPLLVCCFGAGLTDSTLCNAYGTFVSMQTGNTIFVALGASGQSSPRYGWVWSLCSMGSFVAGCLFFARFHAALGARRRATLVLSFLLQGCCACVAAGLIQGGAVDGRHPSSSSSSAANQSRSASANDDDASVAWAELAPVALLSFQSAGQIVASRTLSVSEVPTVVITSLLCDLVSDPGILAPPGRNGKRNRRVAAFLLIFVGAIAGGWITKAAGAVQWALWIVAGMKLFMSCCWLNWEAKA